MFLFLTEDLHCFNNVTDQHCPVLVYLTQDCIYSTVAQDDMIWKCKYVVLFEVTEAVPQSDRLMFVNVLISLKAGP